MSPPPAVVLQPWRIRVGVREPRDQLSRYLERVRHGEEIEVTERSRPFAESRAELAELVAAGVVIRAVREWTGAPRRLPVPAGERPAGELLDEQRADLG